MSMDRSLTKKVHMASGSGALSRQAETLERKRERAQANRRIGYNPGSFVYAYWSGLANSKERADILAKYASMNIPGSWRR